MTMHVTRFWLDVDAVPHTEISQWIALDSGELLTVPALALVTEPIDPATPVVMVSISGQASPEVLSPGYFDLALYDGATIIDQATFDGLIDAGLESATSIEDQLAALIGTPAPEVTSMVNKIAAACLLTTDEKAALSARLT